MPINDLAAHTLFKAAEQGDPNARAALTSVGPQMYDEYENEDDGNAIQPPPIDSAIQGSPDYQGQQPANIPTQQSITALAAPQADQYGSATPPSTASAPSDSGGDSFWQKFKRHGGIETAIGLGLTGLAGALGGLPAASGASAGAARTLLEEHRIRQQEEMARNHKVWADQWEQAKTLGPEVLTDPKFSDLAKAYQGLQQDMSKGDVSNLKNASAFMTAMAKHKDDLEQIQQETAAKNAIKQATTDAQAKTQANIASISQAQQILNAPITDIPVNDPRRAAAQAILANLPKERTIVDPNNPSGAFKAFLTDEQYMNHQHQMSQITRELTRDKAAEQHWNQEAGWRNQELGLRSRELEENRKWREQQYGARQDATNAKAAGAAINNAINDRLVTLGQSGKLEGLHEREGRALAFRQLAGDPNFQMQLARGVGATPISRGGRRGFAYNGNFYPVDTPDNLAKTMQFFKANLDRGIGEGF